MVSVGESLRRERIRRNLDLGQISEELKISAKFLEAIEEERFDRLPGGVFAKSFVRQYARLLDLDEDELAGEVQRMLTPPETAAQPQSVEAKLAAPEIHVPRVDKWEGGVVPGGAYSPNSSLPALAGVVVVMFVCSGVYALWQRSSRRVATARENAPSAVRTHPAQQPAAPAAQPQAPSPPSTVPEEPPAQPAVPTQSSPKTSRNQSADRSAEMPSVSAPPPKPAAPNSGAPVRVEITAEEPVWVLAQNDGRYLFSGTLEPSQTRTVEVNGTVTLRLGNAGGVNITFNGKPIGSVGPRGQVRTVQFTSGGFHILAAPKPSAPLDDIL